MGTERLDPEIAGALELICTGETSDGHCSACQERIAAIEAYGMRCAMKAFDSEKRKPATIAHDKLYCGEVKDG
jgi:hypothetical protein